MPEPIVRIGHGNGHNKASLVDFVRVANADSFGGNETQRLIGQLKKIPNHRVTVAGPDFREDKKPSGSKNRHRSTSIVTKSQRTNIGEFTRQVSERLPAMQKIAPDRVLVCSMYQHPLARKLGFEGIAHFELHPDAAVRNKPADSALVREYTESLVSTRKWMEAARKDDLLVILTGDLQVPIGFKRNFGPRQVIGQPLNLKMRAVGIDWILISKQLRFAGALEVKQLFDHKGFVVNLGAAA